MGRRVWGDYWVGTTGELDRGSPPLEGGVGLDSTGSGHWCYNLISHKVFDKVVLNKSFPAQIRQLILHTSNLKDNWTCLSGN